MKLKTFCTIKEMITRLKRLPIECEKILARCISDNRLIIRIYWKFMKLNSKKINDTMKKWTNELNRAFSEEEVQMTKKIHGEMLKNP
jgi:hypothetical protein